MAEMHDWVSALNGRTDDDTLQTGHAGFQDWRPPTIGELKSIVDTSVAGCGSGGPCIDPLFDSTVASGYWSLTSNATSPGDAWGVGFGNGFVDFGNKDLGFHVRAVRGCR